MILLGPMAPTLLVLAAGMGSRYGGLKQVDPVGPSGETVLDYAVYDARRAGFETFELMATLPGVPLYLACGYVEVEQATLDLPDGMHLGAIRMKKRYRVK
jgi:hypothetical protein